MIGRSLAGVAACALLGLGLATAVSQEPTIEVATRYVEQACTGEGTHSTFKQLGSRTERFGSSGVLDEPRKWLVLSAPYGGVIQCGASGYWREIHVPIREVKFKPAGSGKVEITCLDAQVGRDACIRLVEPGSCAATQLVTKDVDDRMTLQCQQESDRIVRALERWQTLTGGPISVQDDPFAR